MKMIDVRPYNVIVNGHEEPYLVADSLVAVLFNQSLRLSALDARKNDKIAQKIESATDFVLLEEAEYQTLKECADSFRGYARNDLEFVDRIANAEEVEIVEKGA